MWWTSFRPWAAVEVARYVRDVRAVPLWLLREYLVELGAREVGEELVGDGWQACLTPLGTYRVGSLVVGEARVEIEGEGDAVERTAAALDLRLSTRGGG
ncbi:MAG: DUF1952 domain-containing protein [Anaerolineae bacterium]